MRYKWITITTMIFVPTIVYFILGQPSIPFQTANAQNLTREVSIQSIKPEIEVYPVSHSFKPGYINILSQFITSSDDIRYPSPLTPSDIIPNTTDTIQETDSIQNSLPKQIIQYDEDKRVLVVLATPAEHKQIKLFLNKLDQNKNQGTRIMYRLAFVERNIHPKLKNYPFEFEIRGHCWDEGRTRNKYPKWLINYKERFPELIFSDVDTDREDHRTKFEINGYARTQKQAEKITEFVRKSKNTDSDTKIIKHDFMQESSDNLHFVLSDIFPNTQLNSIISSLQHTQVYQVESEASLASESSVPGHFQTVLGDEFTVQVSCNDTVQSNRNIHVDIYIHKKQNDDDLPFDDKNLHLSTSLITSFGQINMLGIRHNDKRYVILFSMEEI